MLFLVAYRVVSDENLAKFLHSFNTLGESITLFTNVKVLDSSFSSYEINNNLAKFITPEDSILIIPFLFDSDVHGFMTRDRIEWLIQHSTKH